ncbi:uncharacterized protein LOC117578298 [Drosophila albomicans]|uniref:Uncharacterized protein LOC117578298 n=2 Tax=nasuta subgroup TaxID=32307 RepID=A0A6P8Y0Y4_DROAB|nr:uncharacterized protein LOC117578298 [Drosophila albomicans]XP_034119633.1 uncharacterized protein LOC117578298 [Drosophila albomicans]XP_051864758.1 uncharacterized protein LOC117578298 [Drosophila albomicans]XP_051864759.1 uncharacterized protein LOC117578298 [Drosophila albomicans]
MPYYTGRSDEQLGNTMRLQIRASIAWSSERNMVAKLTPLVCTLIAAGFAYGYTSKFIEPCSYPARDVFFSRYIKSGCTKAEMKALDTISIGVLIILLTYIDF